MFVYFDSNGVLKEIISDGAFRNGDSQRDKIYIYVEGEPYINSAWIKFKLPNGTETTETCFFDRTTPIPQVAKTLPTSPLRNLKYFSYDHTYVSGGTNHLGYMFYVITVPSAVLNSSLDDDDETPTNNNLVLGRARFVYPNSDVMSLGAIAFSVESNMGIITDNSINESQYNYLLAKSDLGNPIYFTPYFVGTELNFSNNGNLPNPAGVDLKGETGTSVNGFSKISTVGLTDTYRLTLDDGTYYDIPVKNGKSITSIEKTSTSGLTDTYTITYNDGTTSTFDVVNGKSITSITKTASVDNVDTYTISFNDGTSATFNVVNGIDGTDGDSAGFGSPTITVNMLSEGSTPTASVGASGPDTAKVFSFVLNIPKGDTGKSTQWYFGSGSPANDLGDVNDIYCNQVNWNVYLKTGATTWTLKGNIKGTDGNGIQSIYLSASSGAVDTYTILYTDTTTTTFTVTNSNVWRNGSGVPSNNTGYTNDYYLNTSNGDVYKKGSSTWSKIGNIKGSKGDTGPSMLMDMSRDPTSNISDFPVNGDTVVNGAYWLNTTSGAIFKFDKDTSSWNEIYYEEIINLPSDHFEIDTTSSNCVFDNTAMNLSQRIYIDTRTNILHVTLSLYGEVEGNYDNSSIGIVGKIKYLPNYGYYVLPDNVLFDGDDYSFLTQALVTNQSMASVKPVDILLKYENNMLLIKLGTYNNGIEAGDDINLIISCDIPLEKL